MKTIPVRRSHRGVAAVEMALLLVPLLLFALATTELGRALYSYNTLLKSTRDGARYLSMVDPGTGDDAARCLVVYGNTSCTDPPLLPGLATSMVQVPPLKSESTGQGSVDVVKVVVHGYRFDTLIPGFDGLGTAYTFPDIATTMRHAAS